jgi:serine/threonine-protein kinase HipA
LLGIRVANQGLRRPVSSHSQACASDVHLTAARADAVELVRRVWSEVRQWKTTFEAFGADAKLLAQMASAFRELEDIASPELVAEIRNVR